MTGSWGESFVDLSLLGVKPGDTVRLRFDFGMDGCTGIDGWYVDDITVSACNASKEASIAARGSSVVLARAGRDGTA